MAGSDLPIRLSEHDDGLLRILYVRFGIPRDQYKKRPEDSARFEREWRRLSGRNDTMPELVRYMQNQQKAKRRLRVPWPVFNGSHKKAPALSGILDEREMEALKAAYVLVVLPLGIGTDAAAWTDEVITELARQFTKRTGRIVPGLTLMAIAEEKRKRGLWFKLRRGREEFGGLDEVANGDY
jgi:hypothetical protein